MSIRKRRGVKAATGALAAGLALVGMSAVVRGQQPTPAPTPLLDLEGAGVHFPRTPEDHLAVADEYVKKAADHRKEVDFHRRMLAAYERLAADLAARPVPPQKRGKTVPAGKPSKGSRDPVAEYRAHCEGYMRGAELLAAEADKLAEFHRARAREPREPKDP